MFITAFMVRKGVEKNMYECAGVFLKMNNENHYVISSDNSADVFSTPNVLVAVRKFITMLDGELGQRVKKYIEQQNRNQLTGCNINVDCHKCHQYGDVNSDCAFANCERIKKEEA